MRSLERANCVIDAINFEILKMGSKAEVQEFLNLVATRINKLKEQFKIS